MTRWVHRLARRIGNKAKVRHAADGDVGRISTSSGGYGGITRVLPAGRVSPLILRERYALSDREFERMIKMVNHKAMALNCMLYRANRLAPLAMNLHEFCTLLGTRLGPFYLNTRSFIRTQTCIFIWNVTGSANLYEQSKEGYELEPAAKTALEEEHAKIKMGLIASYTAV